MPLHRAEKRLAFSSFSVKGDDGSKLFIDDELVIDNFFSHAHLNCIFSMLRKYWLGKIGESAGENIVGYSYFVLFHYIHLFINS